MAANTIMQVMPNMVTFSRAATAAAQLFELIDRESEINSFDERGDRPEESTGTIDLHNINFSSPSRPDVTVLENFTLHVPTGKVTALVVSWLPICLPRAPHSQFPHRDLPAPAKAR
jgi:ATP-binding cassette subfamily B (MDR/TAP) protein 1